MLEKLGLRHPFFLPLWRRAATVGVIGAWGLFELWGGHMGWALGCLALAILCVLEFFVLFKPENYGGGEDG